MVDVGGVVAGTVVGEAGPVVADAGGVGVGVDAGVVVVAVVSRFPASSWVLRPPAKSRMTWFPASS